MKIVNKPEGCWVKQCWLIGWMAVLVEFTADTVLGDSNGGTKQCKDKVSWFTCFHLKDKVQDL